MKTIFITGASSELAKKQQSILLKMDGELSQR